MQFLINPDPEIQPRRTRTLLISIGIHVLLVALVALNPDFLRSTPKRIIRIAGHDYDLSKNELTELIVPPPAAQPKPPALADNTPLIQPPMPNVQPPPPPPPPPPQQTPPVVIGPEDVIAEGARPDAPPRPSRGDTQEPARVASGASAEPPKPAPKPEPKSDAGPEQIARNTNPNALRLPNLIDRAGRIIEESIEESRRRYNQGGRTGIQGSGQEDPNFSTEEPTILSDTRGYDFGPYMNQVVNRVRLNWYSLIPEVARLGRKGRVVIIFTIVENGSIQDFRLVANSGTDPLDRAAMGAITSSNPFPRLPSNFDGDHLVLQFTFLYNMR